MSLVSRLDRHSRLVGRMADALDVDLEEKMMRGEMRPEEMRSAVLRCVGCSDPGDCTAKLDDGLIADEAPVYCRNQALMAQLRD